jgi:hypothetical protein
MPFLFALPGTRRGAMTRQIKLELTPYEIRILRFYRGLREERFCRSIKTIAESCSVGTRTVQRANLRFQKLGILALRQSAEEIPRQTTPR